MLNEDRGYVSRWEDFRWIAGAREAVAAFNRAGWLVIVVTNQSGVGRGFYTEDDMHALHARMAEDLAEVGGHIDAFYHAPQHPEAPAGRLSPPRPAGPQAQPGHDPAGAGGMADRPGGLAADGRQALRPGGGVRAGIRGVLFEGGDLAQFLRTRRCCRATSRLRHPTRATSLALHVRASATKRGEPKLVPGAGFHELAPIPALRTDDQGAAVSTWRNLRGDGVAPVLRSSQWSRADP